MNLIELIHKIFRKLKNLFSYFLFQYPRIIKYRFLSDCKRINGKAVCNYPVQICGVGGVEFGKEVNLGVRTSPLFYSTYGYIEARKEHSKISIGDNVWINNNFFICSEGEGIAIGANTLIGINFECVDSDFHGLELGKRANRYAKTATVIIGENVFIGSNVKILKGVTIGNNSVIANGSIVTKSIPNNVIAGGYPAKVIREL